MPTLSVHDLGDYLREQRESARLSLRQLSELAGVSNPYLSQIERGLKKPSAEILGQLAKGLRISAESLYVRAGILEERTDGLPLETSILAEPHLSERQKQVLLEIYTSFRTENARAGAAATGPQPTDPTAPSAASVARPRKAVKATARAAKKSAKKSTKKTATKSAEKSAEKSTQTTETSTSASGTPSRRRRTTTKEQS